VKRVRFKGSKPKAPKPPPAELEEEPEASPAQSGAEATKARILFREEQRREGEQAMADYRAAQEAIRKKTALLREARLAQKAKSQKRTGKSVNRGRRDFPAKDSLSQSQTEGRPQSQASRLPRATKLPKSGRQRRHPR
jgi:hypothetical protein